IERLHEELGVTVVAVTHDQGEALSMADRIVVMNEGRIQQTGPPEELYRYPVNAFVTQFIGEANLLKGTVLRREGSGVVARLEDGVEVRGTLPHRHPDERAEITLVLRPESIVVGAGPRAASPLPPRQEAQHAIRADEHADRPPTPAPARPAPRHPARAGGPRRGDGLRDHLARGAPLRAARHGERPQSHSRRRRP